MSFIEGALGSVAGAEATKSDKGGGSGLSKKWHGIPAWALYLGAGLGGFLLYRYYKNQQAANAAATPAAAPVGTTAPDSSGLGAGGGGFGSNATGTGFNPWAWLYGGAGGGSDGGASSAGSTSPTTTVGGTSPAAGSTAIVAPLAGMVHSTSVSTPNPTPASPSNLAAVTLANAQQALSQAQTPAQVQAAQPAVNAAVAAANAAGPQAVANVQSVVAANSTGSVNTIGSQYGNAQTAAALVGAPDQVTFTPGGVPNQPGGTNSPAAAQNTATAGATRASTPTQAGNQSGPTIAQTKANSHQLTAASGNEF